MDPPESFGLETETHPDPRADACLRQIRDAGLMQAIGRPRGVNADPGQPKEVYLLAGVPLADLPVQHVTELGDLLDGFAARAAQGAGPLLLDREGIAPRVPRVVARRDGKPGLERWQRERVEDFARKVVPQTFYLRRHEGGRRIPLKNTYLGESAGWVHVGGVVSSRVVSPIISLSKQQIPSNLAAARAVFGRPDVVYLMWDALAVVEAEMQAQEDRMRAWKAEMPLLRAVVNAAREAAEAVDAWGAAIKQGDTVAVDRAHARLLEAFGREDVAFDAWVAALPEDEAAEGLVERAVVGRECKAAGIRIMAELFSPYVKNRDGRWWRSAGPGCFSPEHVAEGIQRVADAWCTDRDLLSDETAALPLVQAVAWAVPLAQALEAAAQGGHAGPVTVAQLVERYAAGHLRRNLRAATMVEALLDRHVVPV